MKSKRNKGKPVSVYWVLGKVDLPSGLEFFVDPGDRNKQHLVDEVTGENTDYWLERI